MIEFMILAIVIILLIYRISAQNSKPQYITSRRENINDQELQQMLDDLIKNTNCSVQKEGFVC